MKNPQFVYLGILLYISYIYNNYKMANNSEFDSIILEIKEELKKKYYVEIKSFNDITTEVLKNNEIYKGIEKHNNYLIHENIKLFESIINEKKKIINIIMTNGDINEIKYDLKYYNQIYEDEMLRIMYLFGNLFDVFRRRADFERLDVVEFYRLLFIKIYKLLEVEIPRGESTHAYTEYLIFGNKNPIEYEKKLTEFKKKPEKEIEKPKSRWF